MFWIDLLSDLTLHNLVLPQKLDKNRISFYKLLKCLFDKDWSKSKSRNRNIKEIKGGRVATNCKL